jgi:hypothetical protein
VLPPGPGEETYGNGTYMTVTLSCDHRIIDGKTPLNKKGFFPKCVQWHDTANCEMRETLCFAEFLFVLLHCFTVMLCSFVETVKTVNYGLSDAILFSCTQVPWVRSGWAPSRATLRILLQ